MTLYLAFGVALFALAFLRASGCIDRRYEMPLVLCISVFAFGVSFLRWETGADWDNYIWMFRDLRTMEQARGQGWWEPGYAYVAVLVHSLGGGYTAFLFCIAALLFSIKYWLLQRTSAAPLIAVFVLYCTSFYDVFFTRQSVAVIFFWAFVWFYFRRNWTAAALAAAGALMYHTSAAVPLALVVGMNSMSFRKFLLFTAVAVVGAALLIRFMGIGQLMEAAGYGRYAGEYIEVKAGGLSTTARSFIKLSFWVVVAWAAFAFFIPQRDPDSNPDWLAFCLKCATAIIGISIVLVPVSEIFARIPDYSRPLFAVILSGAAFRPREITLGSAVLLATLAMLFIQLGFLYGAYPDSFYPFRSILW